MTNTIFRKQYLFFLIVLLSIRVYARKIEVAFSPGNSLNSILSSINNAKQEIRLAAYSFTSYPISNALVNARKKGINVYVLADKKANTSRYTATTSLINNQIPVCLTGQYKIMHNKFMIIDKQIVETGSFNYSDSAVKVNAENVITVNDKEVASIYLNEFFRLWRECQDKALNIKNKRVAI